jgi:6-phosphogluconolactonase
VADTVSLHGELRVVDDVPRAFSALVVEEAPASLALSGGSTARASYELLAVADVDWSEVDVFFGDERWVPVDDPESNEGSARQAFIDQVHPRAVYSMRHAGDTIEEAADAYDRLLREYGPLDLVHLGLGPDGHTASLFPGHPLLQAEGIALCVPDSPKPPPERMTLTLGKLNESRRIVVVVTGEEKAPMLARVLAGPNPGIPASLLARDRLVIIADATALPRV